MPAGKSLPLAPDRVGQTLRSGPFLPYAAPIVAARHIFAYFWPTSSCPSNSWLTINGKCGIFMVEVVRHCIIRTRKSADPTDRPVAQANAFRPRDAPEPASL